MNFKVNDYTTINEFKRLGIFEDVMKFGNPSPYEQFTGVMSGEKVKGLICLKSENIYNLTKI